MQHKYIKKCNKNAITYNRNTQLYKTKYNKNAIISDRTSGLLEIPRPTFSETYFWRGTERNLSDQFSGLLLAVTYFCRDLLSTRPTFDKGFGRVQPDLI